ncbi:hypothetical protein BS17DRAFT_320672 [Gyrodon lividus]|nr:hypothetical protein BS17DRAFT_320672 [Gyrodon lividus]
MGVSCPTRLCGYDKYHITQIILPGTIPIRDRAADKYRFRNETESLLRQAIASPPNSDTNRPQVSSSTHVRDRDRLRYTITSRFRTRTRSSVLNEGRTTSPSLPKQRRTHTEQKTPNTRNGWIAESRTRPVYAIEVGPFPDEMFFPLRILHLLWSEGSNVNDAERNNHSNRQPSSSQRPPGPNISRTVSLLNQVL